MSAPRDDRSTLDLWVNLLAPGAGLVLRGKLLSGVIVGLLFALFANLAIVSTLLFPDEVSRTWRALWIGTAVGTFVAAQLRFVRTVSEGVATQKARRRHDALRIAREAIARGDIAAGREALQPLAPETTEDLLVAYRFAQLLTASGERAAALAAWQRLRRLDRHRIYRAYCVEHEQNLRGSDPEIPSVDATTTLPG